MPSAVADMLGPNFVVSYPIVILVILAVAWITQHRDQTAKLLPVTVSDNPDPYEIAYLQSGEYRVLLVVMIALVQRDYLATLESEPSPSNRKLSHKKNHPDPRHLSPIEAAVFATFSTPSPASKMSLETVKNHCTQYELRFRDEQLWFPEEARRKARWVCLIGVLIVAGLGGYKLMTLGYGLSDILDMKFHSASSLSGEIVFALGTGLVGIYVLGKMAFGLLSRRLSLRGKNYMKDLGKGLARVKDNAASQARRVPAESELLLLVAMYGPSVLEFTPYALLEEILH